MVTAVKEAKRQRYSKKQALAAEPSWNNLQKNILDAVESGLTQNLRIGAVAGAGKSSVLVGIVNRLPASAKIGILAFNRHIADAMAEKVPTRVTVTTAHGMGYGMLCRVFSGKIEVEESKYRKIARGVVREVIDFSQFCEEKDQEKALEGEAIDFATEMIRFCQSTLTEPTIEGLKRLINYYSIEVDVPAPLASQLLRLVPKCLEIGEQVAREKQIVDFGDMLWLIEKWDLVVGAYDYLLIDEVQDANNAQLALYRRLVGDTGRLIAVGDPAQSIMGFSGSTPDMWQEIQRGFNTFDMPMSVCFRCPSGHLDLARIAVPSICAADNAIQGEIHVVHPGSIKEQVQSGDLIICRFTAPLVSLCLKLIVQKVQAKVRGRDIGASLIALVNQASKKHGHGMWASFGPVFFEFCNQKIDKLKASDQLAAADSLSDRLAAVMACYEHFRGQCQDLETFKVKVQELFTDESTPVILSTIHRAKGDEADRVWLLQPNVLPYLDKCQHEWQEQQERNLTYVALTRAKRTLFLVPLLRFQKSDDIASSKLDELLRDPLGGLNIDLMQSEFEPEPMPVPIKHVEPEPITVDVEPFPFKFAPMSARQEPLTELDTRTLLAANWFLDRSDADLPKPPFQLSPVVTVMGPRFYGMLRVECETVRAFAEGKRDKRHPRHKSGALLGEIQALRDFVESDRS
jgi:hypothetical protein